MGETQSSRQPLDAPTTLAADAEAVPRGAGIRLAVVGGAVAVLVALYSGTFWKMASVWIHSVTFRHGLVIVPVCAWLIWSRRHALAAVPLRPAWWALPGLSLLSLAWLLGWLADVNVVQELAVVAMIPVLITMLMGSRAFRALRFPLLYVFFAVPIGFFLVSPLMHATANMAVSGLRLSGIPVFQDGFRISVPTGDFLVEQACSGIRYLIACLALGTLFAHLFYRSWPRRLAFVAISLIVPIIANGIRAYGIILLAYLSDMRIATGFDHVIYGFVFFSLILLILFSIGAMFREDLAPRAAARAVASSTVGEPRNPFGRARFVMAACAAVLAVAAGPVLSHALGSFAPASPARPALPRTIPGWQGPSAVHDPWRPHFVGAHRQSGGVYVRQGHRVVLWVEAYAYPRRRGGVVDFRNRLVANPKTLVDSQHRTVALAGGALAVRQAVVQEGETPRLVWSWYRVAGHDTTDRAAEKIREVLHMLVGGHGWAQWVSISTPMRAGLPAAQRTLHDFLGAAQPRLDHCLSGPDARQCRP